MTYQDLITLNTMLSAVPLTDGKHKVLSAKNAAEIIILQGFYRRKVNEFQKSLNEEVDAMKKDGYDDRLAAHNRFIEIEEKNKVYANWESDKDASPEPPKPSDEDIKAVEELREQATEFQNELEELGKKYEKLHAEKLSKDIPELRKMSRDCYESIIELIGFNGSVTIDVPAGDPVEVPKLDFLKIIGAELVQEND